MRRLFLPFGLAAALLSPWSALAQQLTLPQALEQAAARNPALSAARHELEAAEAALLQAGTRRNPTLSASIEDLREDKRTTTATLDIPIETGGKRAARMTAAERARDVARANLAGAQAQVRATVVAAFFQSVVAQERAKLSVASAELAGRAADAAARRVAAGKVSPVEETRAGVDHANARLEAAEAQAELEAARQALGAALGQVQPQFAAVEPDTAIPARPAGPQLASALDTSPLLAAGRLEVERRRALLDVERTRARPDVTLSIGSRRDNDLGRTQAIVGVSIPLPVMDRNQGAITEAARLADKAGDDLEVTRLRLSSELQQAASRLAVARTSLDLLQQAVLPAAQRAYEAATIGFEAGKFGFIDVLDAQRSLLAARTRYLNTLAAAHQSATAIDRIVGP